jgi:hypothetical protein
MASKGKLETMEDIKTVPNAWEPSYNSQQKKLTPLSADSHTKVVELITSMQRLSKEDLSKFEQILGSILIRRRGLPNKSENTRPFILPKERELVIPEFSVDDPNAFIRCIVAYGKKLDYTIRLIPYKGVMKDIPPESEEMLDGILIGYADTDSHINISSTENPYESGRKYARAQMIKKIFSTDPKLGSECLKRNNEYFGNNPGETVTISKKQIRIDQIDISDLCPYKDWKDELTLILNKLLKAYHVKLTQSVIDKIKRDNILPAQQVLQIYCSKTITIGKGKNTSKKTIIPHIPKNSSLLTDEEMDLIRDFLHHSFIPLEFLKNTDTWSQYIISKGFTDVKQQLMRIYEERMFLLERFSILTNKRLKSLRDHLKLHDLRKKDVQRIHLDTLIHSYSTPFADLANLVLELDPDDKHFVFSRQGIHCRDGKDNFNYQAYLINSRNYIFKRIGNLGVYGRVPLSEMPKDMNLEKLDPSDSNKKEEESKKEEEKPFYKSDPPTKKTSSDLPQSKKKKGYNKNLIQL